MLLCEWKIASNGKVAIRKKATLTVLNLNMDPNRNGKVGLKSRHESKRLGSATLI